MFSDNGGISARRFSGREEDPLKALVFWCRWHDAKLRLRGRDDSAVWGQLAFPDETRPFHFDLESWQLTIGEGDETELLQLDEMGVEVKDET